MKSLAPFLLCLLLASCGSAKFEKDWATHGTKKPQGIEGRWVGRWKSDVNGHEGSLRCLMEPSADGKTCHCRYLARWAGIFSAEFDVTSTLRREADGSYRLEGAKDLGKKFGGTFSHLATATPDKFQARYSSKLDRGTMEMTRP